MLSKNGLLTTIAWGLDGEVVYALEGSVFVAGASVQWLRDQLEFVKSSSDTEEIAWEASEDHGLTVIPAFTGLGAPYWDMHARGAILGITRGTTWQHIVRATLESIALQVMDVILAMEEDASLKIKDLRVDGGASANNFLMQYQADVLQTSVTRMDTPEITVLGAAYMAGLTVGFWKDKEEIRALNEATETFIPEKEPSFAKKSYAKWRSSIEMILTKES